MIPGWQMEAYERLRTEIVRLAAFDLKAAMRKSDRMGHVCNEQLQLEGWFRSKYGQLLCGDNGEYIIEKCRETYKARTYSNGKKMMPDETQKKVYADFKRGIAQKKIREKYRISKYQLQDIIKRWG